MRCWTIVAAGLLAFGFMPLGARADSASQIADVRCMIVSMELPKEEGESAPTAAMISVMFFLGRIEGRDPDYDVKAAIGEQMAVMTTDDRRKESKRCVKDMLEQGEAAEQLGIDLRNQGNIDVRPM